MAFCRPAPTFVKRFEKSSKVGAGGLSLMPTSPFASSVFLADSTERATLGFPVFALSFQFRLGSSDRCGGYFSWGSADVTLR
jgi:hypothetical protein